MEIAIIISTKDMAGMNIKNNLLENNFISSEEIFENSPIYTLEINHFSQKIIRLYTTDKDSISCENIDELLPHTPELIIFATKHSSKSEIPSLSVHAPGNWSSAELGGSPNQLCYSSGKILRDLLFILENAAKGESYPNEIILECTHHGPFIKNIPTLFIEIGSNNLEWTKEINGKIIAKTLIEFFNNPCIHEYRTALGIGGLHHSPAFKKIMEKTDFAFSHVCPKYKLEDLSKEMILQAIDRTMEDVKFIILDWKGLAKEKARLREIIESIKKENNIEWLRSDQI